MKRYFANVRNNVRNYLSGVRGRMLNAIADMLLNTPVAQSAIDSRVNYLLETAIPDACFNACETAVNERDFSDEIGRALDNYDFSDQIADAVDIERSIENTLDGWDFSDAINDSLRQFDFSDALNDHDFRQQLESVVADFDMTGEIETAVNNAFADMLLNLSQSLQRS